MSSLKHCIEPKQSISKYNVNRLRKCAVIAVMKWKKTVVDEGDEKAASACEKRGVSKWTTTPATILT